ncbi:hypothetical protein ISN45_Aa02g011960, partial [Arabidopsis thaliana x Arabidopsis arenosa]
IENSMLRYVKKSETSKTDEPLEKEINMSSEEAGISETCEDEIGEHGDEHECGEKKNENVNESDMEIETEIESDNGNDEKLDYKSLMNEFAGRNALRIVRFEE